MVVGGWQSFLLVDNKMELELNKMKRIEFDSSQAGPGKLMNENNGTHYVIVSPCCYDPSCTELQHFRYQIIKVSQKSQLFYS